MLFVGSEHPRKNLASVLRALRLLKRTPGLRGLKLVKLGAAGRPQAPFRERTRRSIELAGLGEDDVVFCERVADGEMPAWYAGALCLVLPSLHEGFGMPPLEAMASRIVQRGLRHAQGFSWQQAAIETHVVHARVDAGAIPEPSLSDTRTGTRRIRRATHGSWSRSSSRLQAIPERRRQKVDGIILPRDNKPFRPP